MRPLIITILLVFSLTGYGQSHKWELSVQLQPELTLHKDSYAWWKDTKGKTTVNVGLAAMIQYNFNKRFFASSGLSFISRKLQTANALNQAALPPPKQSFSLELVTTSSVSYRIVSVPVNLGYHFLLKDKFRSFVTTGVSSNYLLNTRYDSNFPRYDGAYKKHYWQGYSLTVGLGADLKLNQRLRAGAALSYAYKHQVKSDEYLLPQNEKNLTLEHNYLNASLGIRFSL